jgi:hypothetical protein
MTDDEMAAKLTEAFSRIGLEQARNCQFRRLLRSAGSGLPKATSGRAGSSSPTPWLDRHGALRREDVALSALLRSLPPNFIRPSSVNEVKDCVSASLPSGLRRWTTQRSRSLATLVILTTTCFDTASHKNARAQGINLRRRILLTHCHSSIQRRLSRTPSQSIGPCRGRNSILVNVEKSVHDALASQ